MLTQVVRIITTVLGSRNARIHGGGMFLAQTSLLLA